MDSDTPTIDALSERDDRLSRRVAYLRRAFARGLGHKPTTLESAAIARCAQLTALSEQALVDPAVSLTDKVRIDGSAARARAAMDALLKAAKTKPSARDIPSLDELLDNYGHR